MQYSPEIHLHQQTRAHKVYEGGNGRCCCQHERGRIEELQIEERAVQQLSHRQ